MHLKLTIKTQVTNLADVIHYICMVLIDLEVMGKRKENSTNLENENFINSCEMAYSLNLVSGRWKMLILCRLNHGKQRFSELRKNIIGITERILTLQLRELEKDLLIKRTVYAEVPPRVDYELTEIGEQLVKIWEPLHEWGINHKQLVKRK